MRSDAQWRVLLYDAAGRRTESVRAWLQQRGLSAECVEFDGNGPPAVPPLTGADTAVLLLDGNEPESCAQRVHELLEQLAAAKVATLVWGGTLPDAAGGPLTEYLAPETTLEEVVGRLTTLARYAPLVRRLDQELQHVQRLGRQLSRYFEEVDKEMRLAGHLQRSFLPRFLPDIPPLKFAYIYRPAAWLSGDIFDIFRSGQHAGLFIADAMGHGAAAGLMTMFIRKSLTPGGGGRRARRLISPTEALAVLHEDLARQELPNVEFVTAEYALINTRTLELRAARGGHPYPLRIDARGRIEEIQSEGGLLGIPGLRPDFEEARLQLQPGDKVVLYTDGLEDAFILERDRESRQAAYTELLHDSATLGATELVEALGQFLDQREGWLNPADDVTVLVLEVQG